MSRDIKKSQIEISQLSDILHVEKTQIFFTVVPMMLPTRLQLRCCCPSQNSVGHCLRFIMDRLQITKFY